MANEFLKRKAIADYLDTSLTSTPTWSLLGFGVNTLDENPNAQIDTNVFINDDDATSTVKSYQTQFPFDSYLIKSQDAIMSLYKVGRDHLTGGDAERGYIRVDLYDPVSGEPNTYLARKFTISVEVSSFGGAGGENIVVSGNLNNVGTMVQGKFNTVTKVFTAADTSYSALALSSIVPAAAATGVLATADVVLTFNNNIYSHSITLVDDVTDAIVPATITVVDNVITINPTSSMTAGDKHAVTIFGVTDIYGQTLANTLSYFTVAS